MIIVPNRTTYSINSMLLAVNALSTGQITMPVSQFLFSLNFFSSSRFNFFNSIIFISLPAIKILRLLAQNDKNAFEDESKIRPSFILR